MSKGLEALEKICNRFPLNSTSSLITSIEKELKVLDVIDSLFDFSIAFRFPNYQPMLMIINKRTNEYWEIPLTQEQYESMKEILS